MTPCSCLHTPPVGLWNDMRSTNHSRLSSPQTSGSRIGTDGGVPGYPQGYTMPSGSVKLAVAATATSFCHRGWEMYFSTWLLVASHIPTPQHSLGPRKRLHVSRRIFGTLLQNVILNRAQRRPRQSTLFFHCQRRPDQECFAAEEKRFRLC